MRALPPVIGVLGKADLDGELEIARRLRLPIHHRHRVLREDRRNHARIGVLRERPLARGHLVEDHAEREDVGAGISVAAFELLRRHIAQRAQNRVRTGEVGRLSEFVAETRHHRLGRHLREPEVEELHARRREHDVARFDIPVHDAMPVGERDSVGERGRVQQRVGHWQRALQQPTGQRFALEIFHDEELHVILESHVVERADVRVVQRGDRPHLALEALAAMSGVS